MDYAIICVSSILFSLQFLFHKNYNDKYGSSINASLVFSIYTSILGGIILFIIGYFFVGMEIKFTLFSILLATVYSIIGISFTIVSAKALDKTNLSIFSMFARSTTVL